MAKKPQKSRKPQKSMSQRTKYILFGALFVSIAINMFIVGVAAYHRYHFADYDRARNWVKTGFDREQSAFIRLLPENDQETARAIFSKRRAQTRKAFDEIIEVHHDMHALVDSGSTDAAKIEQAINRSYRATAQVNDNFHGLLRDMLTEISPEGHKIIIRKLAKRQRHGRWRARGHGKGERHERYKRHEKYEKHESPENGGAEN